MIILKFERGKLAQRLKAWLAHTNTTQIQLANLSGLTLATVHKIVHGHGIKGEKLVVLAYFLDIDLRDYITETDSETGRIRPRQERQLTFKLGE